MTINNKKGFTLIELSIVLVIIGLIVGGVLVGQDLIHAATRRAEISTLTKFETAINTFRLKYNAVPGDYSGLVTDVTAGHYGNNDGIIQVSMGASGEPAFVWEHLSKAGLIEGSYNGDPTVVGTMACTQATCPLSKLNPHDAFFMSSIYDMLRYIGDTNVYGSPLTRTSTNIGIIWQDSSGTSRANMNVLDVWAIDQKLDDGIADRGRMLTVMGIFTNGSCITNSYDVTDGSADYNLTSTVNDCFPIYILH